MITWEERRMLNIELLSNMRAFVNSKKIPLLAPMAIPNMIIPTDVGQFPVSGIDPRIREAVRIV